MMHMPAITLRLLRQSLTACLAAMALCSCGCRRNTAAAADDTPGTRPAFDTDSAMSYLRAQTLFGPRVPGTEAHRRCGDYLAATLRRLGADTVIEQRAEVTAWNGDRLPLRNILARFNTAGNTAPVLLAAHWDSRPWADSETSPDRASQAIDGANDGASGVAVLLEIARQAQARGTLMPLDILLVDGEDYGAHGDGGDENSWCLGTQQWLGTAPYASSPSPRYALLLDMVGGRGAQFHRERISDAYAPAIVNMVWNEAARIGLSHRFVNTRGGAVVDDHLFLNRAGIPAIDIIESMNPATGTFNPTWHTLDDTYENIDPAAVTDTGLLVSHLTIKNNVNNDNQ